MCQLGVFYILFMHNHIIILSYLSHSVTCDTAADSELAKQFPFDRRGTKTVCKVFSTTQNFRL